MVQLLPDALQALDISYSTIPPSLDSGLVLERIRASRSVADQGSAILVGTLLLGGSAGQGNGFRFGAESLLLAAVFAAKEGHGADEEGDEDAEDDGYDNASSAEGIMKLHADIDVVRVVGAEISGRALARGDFGGEASESLALTVVGLDGTRFGRLLSSAEAVGSLLAAASLGRLIRRGRCGRVGSRDNHGSVSSPQFASPCHLVAPVQNILGLDICCHACAAGVDEAVLDIALLEALEL